jgi:hypothetical protein
MKAIRWIGFSTVVAVLTLGVGARAQSRITKTLSLQPGGEFVLSSDLGSVTISGLSPTGAHLAITSNREQINSLFEITYVVSPGRVQVTVRRRERSGWFNHVSLHFDIEVPAQTALDIRTRGGGIRTSSLRGNETLTTSGGAIDVSSLDGHLLARTSGGSIRLREVTGNAEVETSGGPIGVASLEGSLVAHTSGGPIRIDGISGRVDAHTSGGSIEAVFARDDAEGGVLETSGGSIRVALDPAVNLEVDASTSGGSVLTDLPLRREGKSSRSSVHGAVGSGGALLRLHTSGGSIRITSRPA